MLFVHMASGALQFCFFVTDYTFDPFAGVWSPVPCHWLAPRALPRAPFSLCPPSFLVNKAHLHTNTCRVYISKADLSPELKARPSNCLLDPYVMSSRLFKLNASAMELPPPQNLSRPLTSVLLLPHLKTGLERACMPAGAIEPAWHRLRAVYELLSPFVLVSSAVKWKKKNPIVTSPTL